MKIVQFFLFELGQMLQHRLVSFIMQSGIFFSQHIFPRWFRPVEGIE